MRRRFVICSRITLPSIVLSANVYVLIKMVSMATFTNSRCWRQVPRLQSNISGWREQFDTYLSHIQMKIADRFPFCCIIRLKWIWHMGFHQSDKFSINAIYFIIAVQYYQLITLIFCFNIFSVNESARFSAKQFVFLPELNRKISHKDNNCASHSLSVFEFRVSCLTSSWCNFIVNVWNPIAVI